MSEIFPVRFHDADKSQLGRAYLKQYFISFIDSIPSVMESLESKVREDPEFENWEPNLSIDSFSKVCIWHSKHLGALSNETVEMQFNNGTSAVVDVKKFANDSYSQIMDIGLYFGECLKHELKQLTWGQDLTSKNWIDYGNPVLQGFKNEKLTINPRRMALVISSKIAKMLLTADAFVDRYWKIVNEENAKC